MEELMNWSYNPLCPCKQCTGEGLGWIKHLTPAQAKARLDRLERERERREMEVDGIIWRDY
jgi:hypothetical protein